VGREGEEPEKPTTLRGKGGGAFKRVHRQITIKKELKGSLHLLQKNRKGREKKNLALTNSDLYSFLLPGGETVCRKERESISRGVETS